MGLNSDTSFTLTRQAPQFFFKKTTMAEYEERRGPVGGFSIVTLALGIAMLVVGLQYQDECKNHGAYYLEVEGGLMVGWCILGVVAICMGPLAIIPVVVGLISGLTITIWGSVNIFGSYSKWTSTAVDDENYCPYTPFMWSFVWLILKWVLLPLFCCCGAAARNA